jgi:hypothetical protein
VFGEAEREEGEAHPLAQLGNYITANIQSERRSIIELYSTSFSLLQRNDRALPELTPKKTPRRRTGRETLEVGAGRAGGSHEAGNDRDFIVSNHFPNKFIKRERNRLDLILKEQLKPKKERVKDREELSPKEQESSPSKR